MNLGKLSKVFAFFKDWIWKNKEPIKEALWNFLIAIINVARNSQKTK